jgi:response regulator RpfG family c-di-GMP phosphodiesterase
VLAHYFSLEAQSELDLSEAFCATNASVEAVQFLFHAFGWTPEVEDLVKRGTSLAIKALRSSPSILEMIKRHRENCGAYVSAHSNILIYLCCGISCTLEWHSDFTSAKLCMAALLHDLTLDVEEIENAEQLNKMALEKVSSPAVEIYKTHPAKSAALLSGIKNLPPDIDKIILQHHERPDGKGFPSNLNHSRFTPLGALFVIAEDLVVELGKRPDQEIPAVIQEFITSRSEYYGQGYFKKVLSSLAHSLKVPS